MPVFIRDGSSFESRPGCLTDRCRRADLGGDERKREGGAEAGLNSESRAAN